MKHTVKNIETGEILRFTVKQILSEINRGRSYKWINYDKTDWRQGLEDWTEYRLV